MASTDLTTDVLVVGSGAGGLSTAITARKHGLDVVVVEKDDVFGGTTAFSGGVLWIPGSPHSREAGYGDSRDAVRTYLKKETGNFYDDEVVEAFLDSGPKMVEFFEKETEVKFVQSLYPDYHPNVEGGAQIGRSITAAAFDARKLGADFARLRPPLETITFMGMMFNSSNAELKHFFNATKSLTSFAYVAKRLAGHVRDLAIYRRGVEVTSGNALAARLAKSTFDLGIPIRTSTPVRELIVRDGQVEGAIVAGPHGDQRIMARKGVVLACGGFPHDKARLAKAYPHVARGGEHVSPTPASNTGDGVKLAETAGGHCEIRFPNAAAWMPVSLPPLSGGRTGVFPHLLDRYKPGIIAVNRKGKRFTNESESYHDVGEAMIRDCEGEKETAAWLVCDHRAIRKYGLGYVKPAPVPMSPFLRNGYLNRGNSAQELARTIGVDPEGLAETLRTYNAAAAHGEDPAFGRGTTAFNRYLADPEQKPNPCIAPIGKVPFYAVKIVMGDLGTFDGLTTDVVGRVLDGAGKPVLGLYAAGNDRASMMGGNYPGAGITLGPIMTFGYITGRHLAGVAK